MTITGYGDGSYWHGTIDVIIVAPVERVWEIASDWLQFPTRCYVECTEGQNGVPGCIRRVRPHDARHHWAAEKLVHIDHHSRILAYDLVGGNIGIKPGYQAVFQVGFEADGNIQEIQVFQLGHLARGERTLSFRRQKSQAIREGEGTTRVVWPFRFSPTQDSVDFYIPLISSKVTEYIKELETLAQR